MNYELVKELKDAGWVFKQNTRGDTMDLDGVMVCLPTLPELIKECGEGFFNLQNNGELADSKKKWTASGGSVTAIPDLDIDYVRNGATPEEAVARLWLALHAYSATENTPV